MGQHFLQHDVVDGPFAYCKLVRSQKENVPILFACQPGDNVRVGGMDWLTGWVSSQAWRQWQSGRDGLADRLG